MEQQNKNETLNEETINSTINGTEKKSFEKECGDIGKVWKRNCPRCNVEIHYANRNSLRWATLNNSRCRSCADTGRKLSLESREKIRIGNTGKILSKEARLKISLAGMGRCHTEDFKHKMSERMKGNKFSLGFKHNDEFRRKLSERRKGKMFGEMNPMFKRKGIPMSDETKEKLRKAKLGIKKTEETKRKMREIHFRKKLENGGIYTPKYNPIACEYFDWLNKWHGWNGRYAKNGGEYIVGSYYLDYYEPNLNIAIEWDEPFHYYVDGRLKPKDVFRMNFIKEKLKCDFYRVNSKTMEIKKY